MTDSTNTTGKTKKRALTRDYLVRATYSYLEKFATTEKNLRRVLDRKVRRRLPEEDGENAYALALDWIEDIVAKAVRQNLVNDHMYAMARATSLSHSGNSRRKISQKLQAKGVSSSIVEEVIRKLAEDNPDIDCLAAVKYVRKRRFGAFSMRHDGVEIVEKELASLCRAGFSYTLARRVLKMTGQELEESLYQKD